MGISLQSSGIKVEKDRHYLVNLNADPALNELLVYYLRPEGEVTRVGRVGEEASDIQLSGVGIQVKDQTVVNLSIAVLHNYRFS